MLEIGGIEASILIVASAFGLAINTITGGGSLITLPALLAIGIPLKQSLGINMMALAIGGIGSVFGGLESLKKNSKESFFVLLPTLLGAITGAFLLVITPLKFLEFLIPFLVLLSTLVLFVSPSPSRFKKQWFLSYIAILGISIYGGFFGAGMGVMLVAALTVFQYGEIHALNSLKNLQQVLINAISAIVLLREGLVLLEPTVLLIIGGLAGGYFTGRYLERISKESLRASMLAIGCILSVVLAFKFLFP